MKKNCVGCRALSGENCDLGHKVQVEIRKTTFGPYHETVPQEDCPKPRTYKRYLELKSAYYESLNNIPED